MRYLLGKPSLRDVEKKIGKAQKVFLFLDYDGTLTPIRKTPDLAVLSSSTRRTLQSLSCLPEIVLTIVSGRALNGIRKLVGLRNVNYVGNHGLEMKVKTSEDSIPQDWKIRETLSTLSRKIKARITRFSGMLVENKGLTLSIHFRLAEEDSVPEMKSMVSASLHPLRRRYEIREGKKVLEIRPKTRRNKGWAVNKIIRCYDSKHWSNSLCLYFGDDSTDEDAFKLINSKRGYSVLVGPEKNSSKAHYYLKEPKDVIPFLTWLKRRVMQKMSKSLS